MLVQEFKVKAKPAQYAAIDEAIRTAQFVQNKALRYWMDEEKVGKYDLSKLVVHFSKGQRKRQVYLLWPSSL